VANSFDRKIRLELIGTNIKIEDLDVDIEIKTSIDQTPNEAMVKIWNISNETKSLIKNDTIGVKILFKDIEKDSFSLIFEGNKRDRIKTQKGSKTKGKKGGTQRQIEFEQDGADEATVINLGESYNKYVNTYYQKSFKGSVSSKKIIEDIASKMDVAVKYLGNIPFVKYNDVVFKSSAKNVLNTICDKMGCKWSFQQGAISITKTLTSEDERRVLVNEYNSQNTEKPQYLDNDEIELETILSAEVIPGQWVSVDTAEIKNTLRVVKAEHYLSNYSTANKSRITVKEVSS